MKAIAPCLLIVVLAACASTTTPEAGERSVGATAPERPLEDLPGAVQPGGKGAERPAGMNATVGAPPAARAAENVGLDFLRDPEFRRRFAESYLAESDVEPRVNEGERKILEEAIGLVGGDKPAEAVALLEKGRGPAASAVLDFTLANIHLQQERLEPAAALYASATEKFPKFRRAWRNLGVVHVRNGHMASAAQALTRVVELGGGDGVTFGLLGFAYASLDDHIASESAYRMATLLDPDTVDWRMGLARSFFQQARFAEAVALCDVLIAQQPDRAELWQVQANAYVGMKQPLRAAENLEVVDRLGKATPDNLNLLGDIYVNEEVLDLAVRHYLRALDAGSEAEPERALRAGKVLVARGSVAGARQLVDRIETLHGERLTPETRKDLLRLRARIAVAEGAGEEEAKVLEEIVALDPLDGDALLLLGQHAQRSGDPEKAVFCFERAASLEAFEADAKVRHAQLLVGQGRYAEALPLLRRAQSLKPRDSIQQYLDQVERVSQSR